jgi:hypothetical protein
MLFAGQRKRSVCPRVFEFSTSFPQFSKWYQFIKKWFNKVQEAKILKEELQVDAKIKRFALEMLTNPPTNDTVREISAKIVDLEDINLLYDGFRSGVAMLGTTGQAGAALGEVNDEMFDFYGRARDMNNADIDVLLGNAAASLSPSGPQ